MSEGRKKGHSRRDILRMSGKLVAGAGAGILIAKMLSACGDDQGSTIDAATDAPPAWPNDCDTFGSPETAGGGTYYTLTCDIDHDNLDCSLGYHWYALAYVSGNMYAYTYYNRLDPQYYFFSSYGYCGPNYTNYCYIPAGYYYANTKQYMCSYYEPTE